MRQFLFILLMTLTTLILPSCSDTQMPENATVDNQTEIYNPTDTGENEHASCFRISLTDGFAACRPANTSNSFSAQSETNVRISSQELNKYLKSYAKFVRTSFCRLTEVIMDAFPIRHDLSHSPDLPRYVYAIRHIII